MCDIALQEEPLSHCVRGGDDQLIRLKGGGGGGVVRGGRGVVRA